MAFSNAERDSLYDLLPAFIRERDQQSGEALRGLARHRRPAGRSHRRRHPQLLKNAFIETCEPWVVAYIGDLVGTTPLFDESRVKDGDTAVELFRGSCWGPRTGASRRCMAAPSGRCRAGPRPFVALRSRADVAKTIYYPASQGHAAHAGGAGAGRDGLACAMRLSILNCWAGRNGCAIICASTACARRISVLLNAWTDSTVPLMTWRTRLMCARFRRTRAGTTSAISDSISGGSGLCA